MPTPAPKSCNREKTQADNWPQSFLIASTSRTQRLLVPLLWIIVVCAVFPVGVPSGLDSFSYADGATKVVEDADAAKPAAEVQALSVQSAPATEGSTASAAVSDIASEAPRETAKTETTVTDLVNEVDSAESALPPQEADSSPLSQRRPAAAEATRIFRVTAIVSGVKNSAQAEVPASGATIGSALAAMGVFLNPLDRVSPLASQPVKDGITVKVTRVTTKIEKTYVGVPTETRYKPTPTIKSGTKKTIQVGQAGVIERTERVWLLDGKRTSKELMASRTVKPAKNTIIALGTHRNYMPGRIPYHNRYARAYALSARGGSPRDRMVSPKMAPMPAPDPKTLRALRSITLTATGYSPDPRENGGYTVTATGLPIGYGAAAVDPRVIPLGTKMYVEGYGYAFACDVGGAIKGRRIDLAYDSYYVANTKGRRKVKVWILGQ